MGPDDISALRDTPDMRAVRDVEVAVLSGLRLLDDLEMRGERPFKETNSSLPRFFVIDKGSYVLFPLRLDHNKLMGK